MLRLIKYVLRFEDDADVTMMTAFRKQITRKSTRIRVVQQVIQYEQKRLTSREFKIHWHYFVITDIQI